MRCLNEECDGGKIYHPAVRTNAGKVQIPAWTQTCPDCAGTGQETKAYDQQGMFE